MKRYINEESSKEEPIDVLFSQLVDVPVTQTAPGTNRSMKRKRPPPDRLEINPKRKVMTSKRVKPQNREMPYRT